MLSASNSIVRTLGLRSATRRSTSKARDEQFTGGVPIIPMIDLLIFVPPLLTLLGRVVTATGVPVWATVTGFVIITSSTMMSNSLVLPLLRPGQRWLKQWGAAHVDAEAARSSHGRVSVGELTTVLARFRGQADTEQALGAYAREWNLDLRSSAAASAMLIQHAETLLAGVVGTVSAQMVLRAVISKDQTRVDEMTEMIDEVSRVAVLGERQRLARELHDSVAQVLFSMTLHMRTLELAARQEGRDLNGPFARSMTEMRDLTNGALAEMRAALFQLRPEGLREVGLAEAIRRQAGAITARTGLPVRVHAPEEWLPLDESIEAEVFRVVQEATHNCVKHASPRSIEIRLAYGCESDHQLVVEIVDDGVGFDPSASRPGAMGLASMRERMGRIGGRLIIDSGCAGPTTVRAILPRTSVGASSQPQNAGWNSLEHVDG